MSSLPKLLLLSVVSRVNCLQFGYYCKRSTGSKDGTIDNLAHCILLLEVLPWYGVHEGCCMSKKKTNIMPIWEEDSGQGGLGGGAVDRPEVMEERTLALLIPLAHN